MFLLFFVFRAAAVRRGCTHGDELRPGSGVTRYESKKNKIKLFESYYIESIRKKCAEQIDF